MTLGIQKLARAGTVIGELPGNFAAGGAHFDANEVGYKVLPTYTDSGGSNNTGPFRSDTSATVSINSGGTGSFTAGGGMQLSINFWIRVGGSHGSGGTILTLYRPGYLISPETEDETFTISVSESSISLADTQGYSLNNSFPINTYNTGWHHISIAYSASKTNPQRELYLDGSDIGWTQTNYAHTGSENEPPRRGYGAMGIGGTIQAFQQGTEKQFRVLASNGGFDICQLAIYIHTGDFSQNVFPATPDLGTNGLMPAVGGGAQSYSFPSRNSAGGAGPYPAIYMEFNSSSFGAMKGHYLSGASDTFNDAPDQNGQPSEAEILALAFDGAGTMTFHDVDGYTPSTSFPSSASLSNPA